jgi:ATP-dependent HslUV protease ATP-binding subunit HslU
METEGIELAFTEDAIESLATYAFKVNQSTQNIGARRLYTIMERLLEELSFDAPDMPSKRVEIDAAYVAQRLEEISDDEELSKFIL